MRISLCSRPPGASGLLACVCLLALAGRCLAEPSQPADFCPKADVSACLLWLDACDLDADGKDDAVKDTAPLARWADRSGQKNDAKQDAKAIRPAHDKTGLDGRPAVRFDGKDAYLTTPVKHNWSGDWTVFVVTALDKDTTPHWRGIIGNRFGEGSAKWWTLGTKSDGTLYLELGAGKGVTPPYKPAGTGLQIYTVVKRDATFDLHRNGASLGTATVSATGNRRNELRLGRWYGRGQGWRGPIGEVIVYGRTLGRAERYEVERYLAAKWGVVITRNLYSRQKTWAETMLATRGRLLKHPKALTPTVLAEIWGYMRKDFPEPAALMEADVEGDAHLAWFRQKDTAAWERQRIERSDVTLCAEAKTLVEAHVTADDPRWLELYRRAAEVRGRYRDLRDKLASIDPAAFARSVRHLAAEYPERYTKARDYLKIVDAKRVAALLESLARYESASLAPAEAVWRTYREALLANPLLDVDRILVVKRRRMPGKGSPADPYGLPHNWQSNSSIHSDCWDNEIAVLEGFKSTPRLATLYRPKQPWFVGDVDLHYDARRMLFSSVGEHRRWHVFELGIEDAAGELRAEGLRQVTPSERDVNYYDACYLPDDRILFTSTASMQAVPCVNGSSLVANLYRMDADGKNIRQLCFDQEHDWHPTVMANGRVLYQRWEYTDTPHSHTRLLFHMNPDGTGQMEFYGSNSYWPNSIFYAMPVPGHATKFYAIVSGHHGVRRMGELVLFDAARGRREADGAIQRVPGWGQPVEAKIEDRLVDASWPKFLHPYPLSEHNVLVAAKPSPESHWGIYLVDVFDNMLLLAEDPGWALLEPIPYKPRPRPRVVPDRVDLSRKDGLVYLSDIYEGDGLKGIPRGAVKRLRLFTYNYLYPGMGGPQGVVGMEGPWDIKRIMGTVPVFEDGSAVFRVPANTPIAVQPLDDEGKAVQLMRSWFTVMPGEVLSCVGCHEHQSSTPPIKPTLASTRPPCDIEPWRGAMRGFAFEREVQPVLDRYCVGCHDGSSRDGKTLPYLRSDRRVKDYTSVFHHGRHDAGLFSIAYANLHRFVRRPGLESDYHMLTPMEYHADTTQLVQMLAKGHHGVKLDADAWDRLVTWIDLNAPYHGTWLELAGKKRVERIAARRRELRKQYAGMDDDPEFIPVASDKPIKPVMPEEAPPKRRATPRCEGWPFDAAEAKRRQEAAGPIERTIDLGDGLTLRLVRIPAGRFVMGDDDGCPDESPASVVSIEQPFWMGRTEVTNAQFARFDPSHDSRVESRHAMQFGVRGFYVNGPEQPVVRVSWRQAMAFCRWLSDQTGGRFTLPTEAQWEYACRAGAAKAFAFGDLDADYSKHANLADKTLREFVCHPYKKHRDPYKNAGKYDDWIPRDDRFRDDGLVSEPVGRLSPNAWGLYDMHGNVAEWTRSLYRPYPYEPGDGRNEVAAEGKRVVRGGSWRDRPKRARAGFRLTYRPYQPVYNVGFRVVCETPRVVDARR